MERLKQMVRSLLRRRVESARHPYDGIPLAVVTGVGRSGTAVLRRSLGAHPGIHDTGSENNIIYDVLGTALHNCTYPSRKVGMLVDQKAYDRQFRTLLLNLLWPEPRAGARRPKALMAMSNLQPDTAEYLGRVFPGARVVHIVRSGIEVVSSRMAFYGFKDKPFEWQCEVWSKTQAVAEWGGDRDGYCQVHHGHLLDAGQAERGFRAVFDLLGVPFERRCLDTLFATRLHPTTLADEKPEDAGDLRKRRERWRFWTDEQRDVFARTCGPAMTFFGYNIPWLGDEE